MATVIVHCPYCETKFRLDDARLSTAQRLKCSNCNRSFPPSSAAKQSVPPPAKPSVAPGQTLTLPFDKDNAKETAAEEKELSPPETEPEPEEEAYEISESPEQFTLGVVTDTPKPPAAQLRLEKTAKRSAKPRAKSPREEPMPTLKRDPTRDRGKVRAIFVVLAVTVTVYGLLTQALFASPNLTDQFLQRVPLVGTLGVDRLMSRKVALSEVTGNYHNIKDGKQVFVISGKALNTAPVALRAVQIAGKLYDGNGQVIEQKIIFCGNVISAKVLKDLTPRELSILQTLNPPKHFVIQPGESSTFVIVFLDPPQGSVEFSAQVVAAQRQA